MSKDGGSAFPQARIEAQQGTGPELVTTDGMSLRDYFAGQVVSGWLSSATFSARSDIDRHGIARFAYEVADAMLKARQS